MAFWISTWHLFWRCLCCHWLVSWSVCFRNFMVSTRQLWEPNTDSLDPNLVAKGRACLPKSSFPLLEVKLGSGKAFGIIGKFLDLITQFSIDFRMELLCRKNMQWDASTYVLSAKGQKHVFLFKDDSCVPCLHLKKNNVLSRLNYPYPE